VDGTPPPSANPRPDGMCPFRTTEFCPWRPNPRDARLLGLVAQGKTDREIAAALHLGYRTVGHEVVRLCRMLGIGSGATGSSARRSQLAAWAGAHGLYAPPVEERDGI